MILYTAEDYFHRSIFLFVELTRIQNKNSVLNLGFHHNQSKEILWLIYY